MAYPWYGFGGTGCSSGTAANPPYPRQFLMNCCFSIGMNCPVRLLSNNHATSFPCHVPKPTKVTQCDGKYQMIAARRVLVAHSRIAGSPCSSSVSVQTNGMPFARHLDLIDVSVCPPAYFERNSLASSGRFIH